MSLLEMVKLSNNQNLINLLKPKWKQIIGIEVRTYEEAISELRKVLLQ